MQYTHGYYYQIQIAMFCTKKEWCDFLLCTIIDYHCEQVQIAFCGIVLTILQCFHILVILSELALKAKLIREPKDWLSYQGRQFSSGDGRAQCLREQKHYYNNLKVLHIIDNTI